MSQPITAEEVVEYIDSSGLGKYKYTQTNGELNVQSCPYCNDRKFHFYIKLNADGAPHWCHKCGGKGNHITLKRHIDGPSRSMPTQQPRKIGTVGDAIGTMLKAEPKPMTVYRSEWIDPYHNALLNNEHNALQVLYDRGITRAAIEHFKLGVSTVANGKPCQPSYVIPTHNEQGHIALVKYRTVDPDKKKQMLREANMESVLFNAARLDRTDKRIVVCEGEFDAISLWQIGHTNVVSVPAGAKSLRPEWVDIISEFEEIVLAYDNDKSGIEGQNELRKRLGEAKTYIAELPNGNDCNDVLLKYGDTQLKEVIDNAVLPPIEGLNTIAEELLELQRELALGEDDEKKLSWMFPKLQEVIGGIPEGSLTVVTGRAGTGKTTLLKQQFLEWAKQGEPVFMWCGEMTSRQLTKQLIQCLCVIEEHEITMEHIQDVYEQVKDMPFFFGQMGLETSIESVLTMATQVYQRHGCKVVMIDNLVTLARGRDQLEKQSEVVIECKKWAQHYNGHVFLVAHPRKEGSDTVESRESIAGSQDVVNLADLVFTVFRKDLSPRTANDIETLDGTQNTLSRKTTVLCLKNRYNPGNGYCWLYNEGEYSRFRECTIEDFNRED